MKILKSINELNQFLLTTNCQIGCLADTRFLNGLAYEDDRLFNRSNDIHDALAEAAIPIYSNVISRLELVDLIFRKQVTSGCIQIFSEKQSAIQNAEVFNTLKYVRDKGVLGLHKCHKIYVFCVCCNDN